MTFLLNDHILIIFLHLFDQGKWNLIGENRDQLWMQVFRFGFGRAVSGSTYSEGMGLTHEDQKGMYLV